MTKNGIMNSRKNIKTQSWHCKTFGIRTAILTIWAEVEITNSNNIKVQETIIKMTKKVQLEASQEGKSMQWIHLLHYQEYLQLHHLDIQIALDIQTPLIGTNALLVVHHISNPEINSDAVD